jgi:hypothetical protein
MYPISETDWHRALRHAEYASAAMWSNEAFACPLEEYLDEARDAILSALERYTPTGKAQLLTYLCRSIDGRLRRVTQKYKAWRYGKRTYERLTLGDAVVAEACRLHFEEGQRASVIARTLHIGETTCRRYLAIGTEAGLVQSEAHPPRL